MKKQILASIMALSVLITAGCGFHIRSTTTIPDSLKNIYFVTGDPYGAFSKMLKKEMRINNITIHHDKGDQPLPSFRVTRNVFTKEAVSLYQDGKAAEYQLVLDVDAQVIIPSQGSYPLNVKIVRSFFDNPARALGKSTEQDLIYAEMRKEAATKLVRQFITVNPTLMHESVNSSEALSSDVDTNDISY